MIASDTPDADVRMTLFNADGSRAEISGNGIRCFAQALTRRNGSLADQCVLTDAGDRALTLRTPVPGHTRLPAYARGCKGTIIAHHGGHLYPDAGALGEHVGEHLYTVEFSARELWGTNAPDTVCLDLWEPYFARA